MNQANKNKIGKFLIIGITTILALIMFFPIFMVLINSFKNLPEIFGNVLSLPSGLDFSNYFEALNAINFQQSVINTLVITVIGVIGIVLFGSMAGYKLARTPGKLSNTILLMFMSSMFIPFHAIMITLTRQANLLNLSGSVIGLGIIYIGLGVSMSVFLTYGFVKSDVPYELEEAAMIDGATEIQTFTKIVLPLLSPILTTIAILNMLWIWNDFLLPLLMLSDVNDYTLILSVNTLFGEYNNDWPSILAAIVIVTLPIVVIYFVLQKYIVKGITDGAVKG